ncbi:MAG TPA: hypothetical protein VJ862_04385 [Rhodanobacteraceae bacterium]|nr:hypothetical protein [Rhodanobacteraceae bacterium]
MNSSADRMDDFTQTRWSMVSELYDTRDPDARGALTELAVRYWYPVYAYVRRCGHSQQTAQDITQAFLQQVAEGLRAGSPRPQGKFRDWLLAKLNAFLAGEWRDLAEGGQVADAPPLPELEARNRGEHESGETPERAYRRSFALEVLMRGLKRLREEARQTGHLEMCETLEPFLTHDPVSGQYDELARRLGIRPLVVAIALKRLRQRFRELVRQELADTVSSPEELANEQQALFAALDDVR